MSKEPTQPLPAAQHAFSFRRLVFYPLLVAVSLSFFFYLVAATGRRPERLCERLDEIAGAARAERWQRAFDLAIWLQQQKQAPEASERDRAELTRMLTQEPDRKTRAFLALAAGQLRLQGCVPVLRRMAAEDPLETDPLADGRVYAIMALGEIGDPAALHALLEGATSADDGVRKAAAFALGGIGGKVAVAALRRLLLDGVADVRWNAALGLARLSDRSGEAVLLKMADRLSVAATPGIRPGQVSDVLASAAESLAALGSLEGVPLLEKLADGDPDLAVRRAARKGLLRMGEVS